MTCLYRAIDFYGPQKVGSYIGVCVYRENGIADSSINYTEYDSIDDFLILERHEVLIWFYLFIIVDICFVPPIRLKYLKMTLKLKELEILNI